MMLTTPSSYWPSHLSFTAHIPATPKDPVLAVIRHHIPEIELTEKLLDTHASRALLAAKLRERLIDDKNPWIMHYPVPEIPDIPEERDEGWAEEIGVMKVDYAQQEKALAFLRSSLNSASAQQAPQTSPPKTAPPASNPERPAPIAPVGSSDDSVIDSISLVFKLAAASAAIGIAIAAWYLHRRQKSTKQSNHQQ
jgi:hypothetical protein